MRPTVAVACAAVLLSVCPCLRAEELPATPSATPTVEPRTFDASWLADAPRGDGRRTMGRFVPNLGRSFVGVFSRESLVPFLVGAGATAASAPLDHESREFVLADRRFPALGNAGETAGQASVLGPAAALLFVGGRFSHDTRFRAATYDVAQALVVTTAYTYGLKKALPRMRPDGSNDVSFPSGHTSNAFAWATVADRHYGHKVGLPAYAAAGLIGLSRIEKGKHNVSDVLAGATIGLIVGRTVTRENAEALPRQPRLTLGPATDASGRGLGLGVSYSF